MDGILLFEQSIVQYNMMLYWSEFNRKGSVNRIAMDMKMRSNSASSISLNSLKIVISKRARYG